MMFKIFVFAAAVIGGAASLVAQGPVPCRWEMYDTVWDASCSMNYGMPNPPAAEPDNCIKEASNRCFGSFGCVAAGRSYKTPIVNNQTDWDAIRKFYFMQGEGLGNVIQLKQATDFKCFSVTYCNGCVPADDGFSYCTMFQSFPKQIPDDQLCPNGGGGGGNGA